MTDQPPVLFELHDQVAVVTLNRPDAGNVLDVDVLDGLMEHTSALAGQRRIRAMILTGMGNNFSLGGSLDDFERALSGDDRTAVIHCQQRTDALASIVLNLTSMVCPVIAAVNGQAAGAGFSLALACDIRIASPRTKLHFAYGSLGASTDGGMSWLLPRVVGRARALQLLIEQPIIRAPQALEDGLVSEIVPAPELVERALQIGSAIQEQSFHAVSSAKMLVNSSGSSPLADHLRREHRLFADGLLTADMQAALKSRRAGELPTFSQSI